MTKEIGSFYQLNFNFKLQNIYKNIIQTNDKYFFISGRNCIKFLIEKSKIKKYLLPNYLCESIINNFKDVEFEFYDINNDFTIDLLYLENMINNQQYEAIYIIDYFGIKDRNIDNIIRICRENKIIIIQDYTQSITEDLYGDICLASFRKFLPTPFGCVLQDNICLLPKQSRTVSFQILFLNLIKLFAMFLKKINIFKNIWYKLLCFCENKLDDIKSFRFDHINYLLYLLYRNENNHKIRNNNFIYLKKKCKLKPVFDNNFIYPIIFSNKEERDKIRYKLIEKSIYPVVYWPLNFDIDNKCNHYIADRILCLPIDDRYSEIDMDYISDII